MYMTEAPRVLHFSAFILPVLNQDFTCDIFTQHLHVTYMYITCRTVNRDDAKLERDCHKKNGPP